MHYLSIAAIRRAEQQIPCAISQELQGDRFDYAINGFFVDTDIAAEVQVWSPSEKLIDWCKAHDKTWSTIDNTYMVFMLVNIDTMEVK